MPTPLLVLIGCVLLTIGVWGLVAGKIVAGSRGLRPNYHHRRDNPFLYYSFVSFYLLVGAFVLYNAL
jgi:hypothetical protein